MQHPNAWARLPSIADAGRWPGRAAALVLLALVLLQVWIGLIHPFIGWVGGSGPEADGRALLEQFQLLAGRRPGLEADRSELLAQSGDNTDFLTGATPALAEAGLQSQIGALVHGVGARLVSVQSLPPQVQDGRRLIGVKVQLSARIEALRPILYHLEGDRPRLFVKSLAIRTVAARPDLDIDFEVLGYMAEEAP